MVLPDIPNARNPIRVVTSVNGVRRVVWVRRLDLLMVRVSLQPDMFVDIPAPSGRWVSVEDVVGLAKRVAQTNDTYK